MILLPKGNPVKENLDPGKVILPEALIKLQVGRFTGYLRFDTQEGAGILIFRQGQMISALFEAAALRVVGDEAIARIFAQSLAGGALLNIYRLSHDLAMSIHALLHGHVLYRGQELKLIDIKALLGRCRDERINGCLRLYTDERIALIFYRDGSPLGFFHDGSTDIETTADTSMSVARLPGAKLDVLTMEGTEEGELSDLLESIEVKGIWEREVENRAAQKKNRQHEDKRSRQEQEKVYREKVVAHLSETAERHIGKIGASLVEKELEKVAGPVAPLTPPLLMQFFEQLNKAARLVAGPAKVTEMIGEMKKGLRGLKGS
ncbi:MAG: GTPase-activating protein [Desulfuromonas sp.]|nr:MAG: GTPase-activating protein [Desulfuromonas sp.]